MNGRKGDSEVLFGGVLSDRVSMRFSKEPAGIIPGIAGNGTASGLFLNQETFSKHILLLGGIGTGKTNTMFHLLSIIEQSLTKEDVVVIFDTKGDFYENFYRPGDVVLSNDELATGTDGWDYWNIFNEIYQGPRMEQNIREISKMLFAEACEKTNQIFFPAAARDIFSAILTHFILNRPRGERTNRHLIDYINRATSAELREMLRSNPSFRAMTSYISVDDSPQTQGVLSELQQVSREVFTGTFANFGTLAIRNLVREKGGRRIFVEYDLSIGKTLSPIYSLLFDLAIKEALGRKRSAGNVYFVTDEFRLLPHLEHIDDAVNFGRSLGVKFLIGIQNVEQIYDNYGEARARSILSGFSTIAAFRVNDAKSREYVKDLFGKNIKLERYTHTITTKGTIEEKREAFVVEDWDLTRLRIGEAIIGFPGEDPFRFQFTQYRKEVPEP